MHCLLLTSIVFASLAAAAPITSPISHLPSTGSTQTVGVSTSGPCTSHLRMPEASGTALSHVPSTDMGEHDHIVLADVIMDDGYVSAHLDDLR